MPGVPGAPLSPEQPHINAADSIKIVIRIAFVTETPIAILIIRSYFVVIATGCGLCLLAPGDLARVGNSPPAQS